MLAEQPWLERIPAVVTAAITRAEGDWVLTDGTGSLVIASESGGETPLPPCSLRRWGNRRR